MHVCATKVIHRLPWDAQDVLSLTVWDSYLNMYEIAGCCGKRTSRLDEIPRKS